MTMPHERTLSVIQARELLIELTKNLDLPKEVRKHARRVLRHYPSPRQVVVEGLIEERYGRGIGEPFFSSTTESPLSKDTQAAQCDVCDKNLSSEGGAPRFGLLQANWRDQSQPTGEQYEVCLCEYCFGDMLLYGRQQWERQRMFDEAVTIPNYDFGLVKASVEGDSSDDSDAVRPKRTGFMADQIRIPADFDEMGREEIEQTFTQGDREDKT